MKIISISVASLSFALSGCAVVETFQANKTILVKVPGRAIVRTQKQSNGWHFRHMLKAPEDDARRGNWYVAWNNDAPLRSGFFFPYWKSLAHRAPEIADATRDVLGQYPLLIEPNLTFVRNRANRRDVLPPEERAKMAMALGDPLTLGKKSSVAWPVVRVREGDQKKTGQAYYDSLRFAGSSESLIDPFWHLRDDYSELATARTRVGVPAKNKAIRIGHLDNGFDERHAGVPLHLIPEKVNPRIGSRANAVGRLEFEQDQTRKQPRGVKAPLRPGEIGASHGLGTMGLLAGREIKFPGVEGEIAGYQGFAGGAPHAEIVPVRVAPWVASVSTAELAYAIDYASRDQRCDVITMSHGGAPTQAWVDAVNAAYERGTAIFAAESNFLSVMPAPLMPHGIILPSSPVYPAAFRRVVGVTGSTADRRSYGVNTLGRLLRAPWALFSWAFRGSYGADGTSTAILRPSEEPDPSQVKRQGALRPHPVAASAPNTPWLALRKHEGHLHADGLDLNGAGTSSAAPQVAAAAALWLQMHRDEFSLKEWRGKEKPEAVYFALLKSAQRGDDGLPDRFLGAGLLKANQALDWDYARIKRERKPRAMEMAQREPIDCAADPAGRGRTPSANPPPGSLYYEPAGNDYFDGERSFLSFFGLATRQKVHVYCRAGLDQLPNPNEDRATALRRLQYNIALLRAWRYGQLPQHSETLHSPSGVKLNTELWRQAGHRVKVDHRP
jgi:hypothetical protein